MEFFTPVLLVCQLFGSYYFSKVSGWCVGCTSAHRTGKYFATLVKPDMIVDHCPLTSTATRTFTVVEAPCQAFIYPLGNDHPSKLFFPGRWLPLGGDP